MWWIIKLLIVGLILFILFSYGKASAPTMKHYRVTYPRVITEIGYTCYLMWEPGGQIFKYDSRWVEVKRKVKK